MDKEGGMIGQIKRTFRP